MNNGRSPYTAPQAKLADPAPRPGSPYKAVGLGVLTDFGGTFAVSIVVLMVYGMLLAGSDASQEEMQAALRGDVVFYLTSIGGGICSVLGGYVCARVARQSEYTLGVILAVLNVILGLVLGDGDSELGMRIVLNAATIGCVMLGAHIGKIRNRRQRAARAAAPGP